MLRVGLTGGLGSGKSTVAAQLRALGAEVIEADELGRELMDPGHQVYDEIVRTLGPEVVLPDRRLDRARLAQLAFGEGRLNQLNAIVHPAVIAAQQSWMEAVFARDPSAVAVAESALIFEVERDARARGESEGVLADWRNRFDRILVLTAPDEVKIARYVARTHPAAEGRAAAIADARRRLAFQMPDAEKAARADFVLENTGDLASLHARVAEIWERLRTESNQRAVSGSLE
ncbi:MAG TPA: dephospho-CoA kinase [Terracidiphilus sp.]|jgi:dephospho-CoA kinase|nr:dephospho-CoA kinase [Terracidiphilus sp.]